MSVEVAMWIAQGAVSYLAGKGMATLFEENSGSIADVKGWIDNAVREIKTFVSEELHRQLTEQFQRELITKVNATIHDLSNYDLTQPHQRQLLDAQTTRIGELIEATRQLGFAGVLLYANLISMQLLIFSAYVRNHSKSGYLPLLTTTVTSAVEHVDTCLEEDLAWTAAGIDSVVIDPIFRPPYGNADWQGCIRFRGGSECIQNDGYQTIEGWQANKRQERIQLFQAERQRAITAVHEPMRKVEQIWKDGWAKASK